MTKKPVLIGIGGAHIDRRGVMRSPYIRGASIPGYMHEEVGGGMFNALRVAAQFGVEAHLLSVRGGDSAGDAVAAEAKRRGIRDHSSTFLDRSTASYTALLDSGGDVVAALADMEIYETALPRIIARKQVREAIAASDGVLMDANMPETGIARLMKQCIGKPVFALAISPAKAVRLRSVLDRFACLFLNKREARALCDLPQCGTEAASELASKLYGLGLRACVLSDGAEAVCIMKNGTIRTATPPAANTVIDVTGAGDALCGGFISGILAGHDNEDSLRRGLAVASVTVESAHAVADLSDKKALAQRANAVRFAQ